MNNFNPICLGLKIFWFQIFLVPKLFWNQNVFGSKFDLNPKIAFVPKFEPYILFLILQPKFKNKKKTSLDWAGPSSAQLPTSSLLLWFHIWGCFLFVTDSWGWVPQKSIQTRLISIVSKPTKVVIVVVVVVIVFVVFPKKS